MKTTRLARVMEMPIEHDHVSRNPPPYWMVWLVIRKVMIKIGRDNGFFLASGLAFSFLLYSIPLVLIMISLLGYTVLESQEAMEEVRSVIRQFFPRSEQAFAENVATIIADRGLLGVTGFGFFFVFSTMVFGAIRHVLNVVFETVAVPSVWHGTVRDLLMMVFCTVLLIATISATSFFTLLDSGIATAPSPAWTLSLGIWLMERMASLCLGGSLIFGLFRFSPDKTLTVHSLIVGSIVTVGLFEFAKQGFVWYVEFAKGSLPLYGMLGGFLFLFLWLYYASMVLIIGAEVSWAFEHRRDTGRTEFGTTSAMVGSNWEK